MLPTIHWLPVIGSAVAVFAIGALWYSPILFGRAWVKAHGHTPEKIEAMRASMGRAYGVSFACYVVMAIAMEILIKRMDVFYVRGREASFPFLPADVPADAAIVGIVDHWHVEKTP